MKLSNKKIKYIYRYAGTKTPQALAKELHISVIDVENVLGVTRKRSLEKILSFLNGLVRFGLYGLYLLAPFALMDRLYDFANLPQMALIQSGACIVFFLWLVQCAVAGKCSFLRSVFNLPVLCLVLWSLISLIYAHNKFEGFILWMHWTACALIFFLAMNVMRDDNDSARLLGVMLLSGLLTAILGISQHLFELSWVPQVASPGATFANKNMAVHHIILTLPLAFVFLLNSRRKHWIWLFSIIASLMTVYLVYTKTRAGWVAGSVQVVFFFLLMIREHLQKTGECCWNRQKTLALAAAVFVVLVMVRLDADVFKTDPIEIKHGSGEKSAHPVPPGLPKAGQGAYKSSALLRMHIWMNTLTMIKDRPFFGFGLGNHKVFYPLYFRKVVQEKQFSETSQLTNVHNDWLQIFSELGLIGMLVLVWLGFQSSRAIFSLTGGSNPRFIRFSCIGAATAIVGFLVNACFSFPVHRAIPPFFVMGLIGLIASWYGNKDRRWITIGQRWIILTACIIVLAASVWVIRFHYLSIKCDRHYLNISRLEKMKNWKGVIEEGRWAYSYLPWRVKVLSYIGRAYIEIGQPKKGIEVLKKVISAYPHHMNALLNIGVAYGNTGDHEKAIQAYDKVLRIKPDYAKVHNNLANIHMQRNQYDEALKEFKIAAELDPGNSVIHFNVGIVEMQKKRYPEASDAFEKTIRLNPNWDLAHKNLGIIYIQFLNQKQQGIRHLKRALELNPKIADAQRMRKLIKSLEKK